MSNYTDEQLDDLLSYGPFGSPGESRALASDLQTARSELKRALDTLALPEVKRAVTEHLNNAKRAEAARLLAEANEAEPHA